MSANLELVQQNVKQTQRAVLGGAQDTAPTANDQSVAKATQSIGQTTAIVIQDAGDMLRNVTTVEVTAIGAATAAWIATKDPSYKEIIQNSMDIMTSAADLYKTIGTNAQAVLMLFKP